MSCRPEARKMEKKTMNPLSCLKKLNHPWRRRSVNVYGGRLLVFATLLIAAKPLVPGELLAQGSTTSNYQVFVSNERSGDVTVIDGSSFKVVATIPVGKRPRGIHAS